MEYEVVSTRRHAAEVRLTPTEEGGYFTALNNGEQAPSEPGEGDRKIGSIALRDVGWLDAHLLRRGFGSRLTRYVQADPEQPGRFAFTYKGTPLVPDLECPDIRGMEQLDAVQEYPIPTPGTE